jgi:hypothetical protein
LRIWQEIQEVLWFFIPAGDQRIETALDAFFDRLPGWPKTLRNWRFPEARFSGILRRFMHLAAEYHFWP